MQTKRRVPQKAHLRQEILSKRDALSPAERKGKSLAIITCLQEIRQYHGARYPMFYASFRSEVETLDLIKGRIARGLPVVLPRTLTDERRLMPYKIQSWEQDLKIGAYGIIEPDPRRARPVSSKELDLIIVPGSVFDERCARHGYGGGFYDRFLREDAPQAFRIGLAYSCQVVEKAPCEPHDQKMDMIITENGVIRCHSHID